MVRSNDDMVFAVAGLVAGLSLCKLAHGLPKIRSTAENLVRRRVAACQQ